MSRTEGDLPPALEFTTGESRRYWTDPEFHAKVYAVAQLLTLAYGTEKNEALAFGIKAVQSLEALELVGRPQPVNGS